MTQRPTRRLRQGALETAFGTAPPVGGSGPGAEKSFIATSRDQSFTIEDASPQPICSSSRLIRGNMGGQHRLRKRRASQPQHRETINRAVRASPQCGGESPDARRWALMIFLCGRPAIRIATLCGPRQIATDIGRAIMLDIVFIALGLGLFLAAAGYVRLCDRL